MYEQSRKTLLTVALNRKPRHDHVAGQGCEEKNTSPKIIPFGLLNFEGLFEGDLFVGVLHLLLLRRGITLRRVIILGRIATLRRIATLGRITTLRGIAALRRILLHRNFVVAGRRVTVDIFKCDVWTIAAQQTSTPSRRIS